MKTKLTIIVQTYNREDGLTRNLEALNRQSDQNFNLVIFGNGAKYNLDKIVEKFENLPKKTTIVSSETNIGLIGGRNEATKHVVTEYFARIDDDDFAMDDYVEKANKLIANNYDLILVSIDNSRKEKGLSNTVFSGEPGRYIIKTKNFVPFPNILPEDFLSIFYYLSISTNVSFDEVKIHLGDPNTFMKNHNFSKSYNIFASYGLDKIKCEDDQNFNFKFYFVHGSKKLTKKITKYGDLKTFTKQHELISLRGSYEDALSIADRKKFLEKYKILKKEIKPRLIDRIIWSQIFVFFREKIRKLSRQK